MSAVDRYVYSPEGFYVDTTKPWRDSMSDEDPEEPLFEEIDAGETLNDQDFRIAKLEAELAALNVHLSERTQRMHELAAELAALKARRCETCASCDTCAVQHAAWVKFWAFKAEVGFYCSEWEARP